MPLPYENATSGGQAIEDTKKLPTHCINGHPFDAENTRVVKRGNGRTSRQCRACCAQRMRVTYDAARVSRTARRVAEIEAWKRDISAAELSWAAGHFEGEGTISLSAEKRQGYTRPIVSLCSTDREVIALFDSWWPTSSNKKPRFPTERARAVYRWELNSAKKIRAFIDQVRPHLRTERCKTKFALVSEFVDKVLEPHTGKTKPRHQEYLPAIRLLNQRGRQPGQLLLGNGKTVLQHMEAAKLLPAPKP